MDATNPRIRSLLRQAERAAGVGKRAAAQQLYEEIVSEAPEVAAGWLGLAQTTRNPQVRQQAYEKVLALEPGNEAARAALDGGGGPVADLQAPAAEPAAEAPAAEVDPFDQSRAWLDEATRRRQPAATSAPEATQPGSPPQLPQAAAPEELADPIVSPPGELSAAGDGADQTLVCYRHPNRETGLRCYSCDRPICTKCAKRTPVGYRCPQCIREAEGVFYTANLLDYLLAGTVALVLGVIAGYLVNFVGFLVIFIGPAAGSLIGRLAFRAARRHHGRWLPHLVAGLVAAGGLLPTAIGLLPILLAGQIGALGLGLLWPLLYVFLATGAAYYQIK